VPSVQKSFQPIDVITYFSRVFLVSHIIIIIGTNRQFYPAARPNYASVASMPTPYLFWRKV